MEHWFLRILSNLLTIFLLVATLAFNSTTALYGLEFLTLLNVFSIPVLVIWTIVVLLMSDSGFLQLPHPLPPKWHIVLQGGLQGAVTCFYVAIGYLGYAWLAAGGILATVTYLTAFFYRRASIASKQLAATAKMQ